MVQGQKKGHREKVQADRQTDNVGETELGRETWDEESHMPTYRTSSDDFLQDDGLNL